MFPKMKKSGNSVDSYNRQTLVINSQTVRSHFRYLVRRSNVRNRVRSRFLWYNPGDRNSLYLWSRIWTYVDSLVFESRHRRRRSGNGFSEFRFYRPEHQGPMCHPLKGSRVTSRRSRRKIDSRLGGKVSLQQSGETRD